MSGHESTFRKLISRTNLFSDQNIISDIDIRRRERNKVLALFEHNKKIIKGSEHFKIS